MTTRELFLAIGEVREDRILDAAEPIKPKKRRIGLRMLTAAACLCLVLLPALSWWFAPGFASHEQLKVTRPILIGDRLASYCRVNDYLTQWDTDTFLALRKGEPIRRQGGYTVYRLRGREDIAELIFEEADGSHTLWKFDQYAFTGDRAILYDPEWWFYDLLTDAEKEALDLSPYTIADVLRDIFAADSADDIISVRFEKTYNNNTEVGQSVRPPTVTLRGEACAPVWDILVTLVTGAYADEYIPRVPLPEDVLSEQTCRDVTVKFRSGAVLAFEYNPAGGEDGGLFRGIDHRGNNRCLLTVEQNHTLIELAEISFAPTPIPETEPPQGISETATVSPLAETTSTPLPETVPE